jgi:hypothetical protein
MPRPACIVAGLLAAALIAACGGAGHSSTTSSSPSTAPATSSTASTATTRTQSQSGATSTISAGPTSTTATTSAQPPEVPTGRRSQRSKGATPSSGVHIPAAFVIRPGGALTPPLVSAPKGVTIELRLLNADAKRHTVELAAPGHPTLQIAPRSHATEDVTGLRNGTYRLLVDGRTGARLVIGAVPGP